MRIQSIISLCGLAGLILLAGCSSHNNDGVVAGSSAPVPDNATVKLIQDSINADPALKGASITVKVENNRLTLMGTVPKHRAIRTGDDGSIQGADEQQSSHRRIQHADHTREVIGLKTKGGRCSVPPPSLNDLMAEREFDLR